MEYINNFVITLVATIIFMTAVEIISPDLSCYNNIYDSSRDNFTR